MCQPLLKEPNEEAEGAVSMVLLANFSVEGITVSLTQRVGVLSRDVDIRLGAMIDQRAHRDGELRFPVGKRGGPACAGVIPRAITSRSSGHHVLVSSSELR